MKIYFAAPVRGDRSKIETNKFIVELIKELGHEVLTGHTVKEKEKLVEIENNFGHTSIYERDMNWLKECDLMIAEASTPSFGVGYEAGYLLGSGNSFDKKNRKVIILYDKNTEEKVSALAVGNTDLNAIVYGYESEKDIAHFLKKYLQ
ncbi:MAG: nucleoside 2-deoxyribosyltransferase [Candidatus Pacebacteria bacterium]|nr:nucleoside 2-deoxyribosyltransferase [Candidatus Paceibacterota bacterium]